MFSKEQEVRTAELTLLAAKNEVARLESEIQDAKIKAKRVLENEAADYFWSFKASEIEESRLPEAQWSLYIAESNLAGVRAS